MTIEDTIRCIFREELRAVFVEPAAHHAASPPSTQASDGMLTVEEVAAESRAHPNAVYGWIQSGRLEAKKVGRRYLVSRAALQRFLDFSPKEPRAEEPGHLAMVVGRINAKRK